MKKRLREIIKNFVGKKILVIGDIMLDGYFQGHSERISREAPVPIVDVEKVYEVPGGAANTAVNIADMGASCRIMSIVGEDGNGRRLVSKLKNKGIGVEGILWDKTRKTLAKRRVMADGQMVARYDFGEKSCLTRIQERSVVKNLKGSFPEADAVIISDYDYGFLTDRVKEEIERLQKKHKKILVVDSKRPSKSKIIGTTMIKPNFQEALELIGESQDSTPQDRVRYVEESKEKLLKASNSQFVAITLDKDGTVAFGKEEGVFKIKTRPQRNVNSVGAGDVFTSTATLTLCSGGSFREAAKLASLAAEISLNEEGTTTCKREDLEDKVAYNGKIVKNRVSLAETVKFYKENCKRVVFTNGCFDIIHPGHVQILKRAKSFGDILIVGVNSDKSVKKLKGPERPINKFEDRAQVLAGLASVDFIIEFGEDTPINLVKVIKPDVFVKGGDYTRETLPEAKYVERFGGVVKIINRIGDKSTSNIVERIKEISQEEGQRGLSSYYINYFGHGRKQQD